jgi:hypothetical protein
MGEIYAVDELIRESIVYVTCRLSPCSSAAWTFPATINAASSTKAASMILDMSFKIHVKCAPTVYVIQTEPLKYKHKRNEIIFRVPHKFKISAQLCIIYADMFIGTPLVGDWHSPLYILAYMMHGRIGAQE